MPSSLPSPSATRPPSGVQLAGPAIPFVVLRDIIPLTTILGLGAALQLLLSHFAIPFVPLWLIPVVLVFGPWVEDVLILAGLRRNVWMDNVTIGRTFAKLREAEGPREYAELKIGSRYNGPFGALNPRATEIKKKFLHLLDEVAKDPNSGFLGAEIGLTIERPTRNRVTTIVFFRSVEDVQRFAKEKLHQLYWNEYNGTDDHEMDVFHELVTIKAGACDAIYVNSPSHGLARLAEKDEKSGEWRSIRSFVGKGSETSRQRISLE